jgi:integrase
MRAHDLRHAAASAMLARGVPVRVVMDILGHTNVQTTIGTYQHALPELAAEAARRMDAFLDEGSATA